MLSNLKYHIILHLIVLCWGLTGIFGDLIPLSSGQIVFSRTVLACITLLPFLFFLKNLKKNSGKSIFQVAGVGVIVAMHWFFFFESIKVSSLEIGVICMSTTTLFIAFLEPWILKRKIAAYEIVIGLVILIGIGVIFGFETEHYLGIIYGLFSAFCAGMFSVLNGKLIKSNHPLKITFIEMLSASIILGIYLFFTGELNSDFFNLELDKTIYLLILGVICTALAFVASVWLMKFLSPFSISVAINLEPIYTIIIAYLIFKKSDHMGAGFYIGAGIILLAVFSNSFIKRLIRRRKKLTN